MNWKVKLVLAFVNMRQRIAPKDAEGLRALRRQSVKASRLGTLLFDRPVKVAKVINTTADGVPVRIYQHSAKPNQRVMMVYHGGGFVLYGLDSHDNVCRRLCAMNNCIVVSVDYRLAPEHPYPDAHDDAFTALKWVVANIAQYGGNPQDLVVQGDSAGGNLAACMAHRCKQAGISLKAQVMVYPWIDGKLNNPSIKRNGKGYMLTEEVMFWFQKQYTPNVEDQCAPKVSPKYEADHKGLAPAFILTAEFDPLIDDGNNYRQQLEQAGNTVRYKEYPQLFHGFFNIPLVDKNAMQAYDDIRDFLLSIK